MTKYVAKSKSKSKRKPEYSQEGMAVQKAFDASNKGRVGHEWDAVTSGGPKRGHDRGKARDAGPSKTTGGRPKT